MGKRVVLAVMLSGLTVIGAFVYLSPAPPTAEMRAAAREATVAAASASATHGAAPSGTTNSSPKPGSEKRRATAKNKARAKDRLDGGSAAGSRTSGLRGARSPIKLAKAGVTGGAAASGVGAAAAQLAPVPTCSGFSWQQDAQAAYVRDLGDPYGLDGPAGPADDDGLACSLLPVDPARPASTPAGAKLPPPPPPPVPEGLPTTPTMEALLAPELNYFGVSTPQSPFDWKEFELFVNAAKKRPNLLMLFSGWDRDYPRDEIVTTWRRGMLPIITWEPRQTVQAHDPSDQAVSKTDGLKLASIIDGEHDEYIRRYADAIAALGLPVGIRFAHEMNGPWYPWSEQSNGNHRGEFVQAWRHVHDIFTDAGATNAIWIWSPSRVNPQPDIDLAALYPGDDYVDWLGMTGYYRLVDQTPSFSRTFDATLTALSGISDKPVLLSEVGATESGANKAKKVAWIKDLFAGMAANPQIIGFAWFDQSIEGNDWRIESSSAATDAFAEGVADPRYGSGVWYPR